MKRRKKKVGGGGDKKERGQNGKDKKIKREGTKRT